MRTVSDQKAEPISPGESSESTEPRLLVVRREVAGWLSDRLASRQARPQGSNSHNIKLSATLACIFLLAIGVRLLHWQDSYVEMSQGGSWNSAIARHYQSEARRVLDEGGFLFPNREVDPGDARLILHPPGYSALIAVIFRLFGDSDSRVRGTQIIFDALSAVMVFLIAGELFPIAVAMMAATLVAISPHLAYYSLWISPDTLCVLPILVAVYLIIKASKQPRLMPIVTAGALVGISCWLRANALLLAPVLAAAVIVLVVKSRRLGYTVALVGATIIVVSPITIRNWILFHHFIPISIAGGENLVVGIADFDKEGRFGMPTSDRDAAIKDAEWYNRPDYATSAWLPDGVERDQRRYARGLEVIRSHPGWFMGIMLRRASFMLRYNDSSRADWPFTTSRVPIISAEPPVMHSLSVTESIQPVWTRSPAELLAEGSILAPQAEVSVANNGQSLRITGDASEFGDQFASGPIAVRPHIDYLLVLKTIVEQGSTAAKVTTPEGRIVLASSSLVDERAERRLKREKRRAAVDDEGASGPLRSTQMFFASGRRNEVRLTISNNGRFDVRPATQVREADLFELGATRYLLTSYPRALLKGLQKNLFKTGTLLPLVVAGIALLVLAGRGHALVILLAVPAYYICAQSVLSTEYRYILAIHYFLFIASAVTIYFVCMSVLVVIRAARKRPISLGSKPEPRSEENNPSR